VHLQSDPDEPGLAESLPFDLEMGIESERA